MSDAADGSTCEDALLAGASAVGARCRMPGYRSSSSRQSAVSAAWRPSARSCSTIALMRSGTSPASNLLEAASPTCNAILTASDHFPQSNRIIPITMRTKLPARKLRTATSPWLKLNAEVRRGAERALRWKGTTRRAGAEARLIFAWGTCLRAMGEPTHCTNTFHNFGGACGA